MRVRMKKIVAAVLDQAHRQQIEKTMDALEEGLESLYK